MIFSIYCLDGEIEAFLRCCDLLIAAPRFREFHSPSMIQQELPKAVREGLNNYQNRHMVGFTIDMINFRIKPF